MFVRQFFVAGVLVVVDAVVDCFVVTGVVVSVVLEVCTVVAFVLPPVGVLEEDASDCVVEPEPFSSCCVVVGVEVETTAIVAFVVGLLPPVLAGVEATVTVVVRRVVVFGNSDSTTPTGPSMLTSDSGQLSSSG